MATPDNTPTCEKCPSALTREEAVRFFGKDVGTSVCAKFGTPLHRIGANFEEAKASCKNIARSCSEFLNPRPATPAWDRATFTVATPDPRVLQEINMNPPNEPDTVRNCGMCKYQVRPDVVASEFGFGAAMCSAKGDLIPAGRAAFKARSCSVRSFGLVRGDVMGITLHQEYLAPAGDTTNPPAGTQAIRASDPTSYVTDKEVTAEDAASGIGAWRKVTSGERFTYLPIYRRDFFSPEEQAKIPATGDDEHPEDYVDHGNNVYKIAVLWRELDETPLVIGEAGTGKTELFRFLAWLMQLPFERVSITGSSQIDDLAGSMRFVNSETVWVDGRLVSAWSKACVLVVDEPNTGPADVWQFIRPMTDNSKQLVVDQANDPTPRPRNENCYLGLAMNPAWDPKNVGTHMVGDADVNRLMHINMPRPPEKLEREIIAKRCEHDGYTIPRDTLDIIIKIATDIRALTDDGTLPMSWAIRPQLKVARSTRWFDLLDCYRMAVADFLEPEQHDQVLGVVETHLPRNAVKKGKI